MKERHLNLLCDIGDLSALLAGSSDIETFLQRASQMVSRHLRANVCSIYLYEESTDELVLRATVGLNAESVGKVRMRLGEGLVGACLEEMHAICEGSARNNPHFKYFAETGEERYESFLAVPIQRGVEKIGVLVVQHEDAGFFGDNDLMALRASASQLAGAVENARALISIHDEKEVDTLGGGQVLIKGEAASEGIVMAPAVVLKREHDSLALNPEALATPGNMDDIDAAFSETQAQIEELQGRLEKTLPEVAALIFTAHLMMLKDKQFLGRIRESVESGNTPAYAVRETALHYIDLFKANPHAYLQEKANDVEDLARRIISNLLPNESEQTRFYEGRIVIAKELYPSDMLKLTSEKVAGIILANGGITSHVAILARSLQVPLIIVNSQELLSLNKWTLALLDANIGNIYLNPSEQVIKHFLAREEVRKSAESFRATMLESTTTKDGERIKLLANINLLSELPLAQELKAEGVGLYRTEFPFLIRQNFPSEDEQYIVYKKLINGMGGKPVSFRTLDVGGDKVLAYYDASGEDNPELGLRSIRFTSQHPEIFEPQLRAILRAGAGTEKLRIMFPMVSGVDEFLEAKATVTKCMKRLRQKKQEFHESPEIGMMVELPSVIELIDDFAKVADFFSIGTNDFVQYMLAVDRGNEKVASYYCPHHPAVLRGLNAIAKAANKAGIDVSVCGEMAHEVKYLPFLLGIGIRILSVDPHFLPNLQEAIGNIEISKAETITARMLATPSLKEVEKLLMESHALAVKM